MMHLTKREQRLVALGGAAVVLFVLLQFVAFPLADHRGRLHKRVAAREKGLAEMRLLQERYHRLHREADSMASQLAQRQEGFSLFAFLEQHAQACGLKEHIAFMKPSEAPEGELLAQSRVEMQLRGVSLEQLLRFLEKVEAPNNLVGVARMTVQENSRDEAGLDATLMMVSVDRAQGASPH